MIASRAFNVSSHFASNNKRPKDPSTPQNQPKDPSKTVNHRFFSDLFGLFFLGIGYTLLIRSQLKLFIPRAQQPRRDILRTVTSAKVPPWSLTWNLKMMVSKRNLLFQGLIFRFHVKHKGSTCSIRKKLFEMLLWPGQKAYKSKFKPNAKFALKNRLIPSIQNVQVMNQPPNPKQDLCQHIHTHTHIYIYIWLINCPANCQLPIL